MADIPRLPDDPIERLIAIMARLRDPEGGCPWDVEQSFATIAPYTVEEAYEVADAVARGDTADLKGELGDLLFQVIFHARMAEEAGHFDFDAVVRAINEKMVKRHPHVFAGASIADAEAQIRNWEAQKAEERHAAAEAEGRRPSALEDIARSLPALMRAVKLQKRAARVGFDWADTADVVAKIREELAELEAAIAGDGEAAEAARREEVGDLLFAVANLARRLDVEPEAALAGANAKFERRFRRIEALLAETGKSPEQSDLAEMDALWDRAKAEE